MSSLHPVVVALLVAIGLGTGAADAGAAPPRAPAISSSTTSPVTVFAASWCDACRSLERGLTERQVPFDMVDVEKNPNAFEHARSAAGAGSAIPLTGVARGEDTTWILGADIDAVEKAYRAR